MPGFVGYAMRNKIFRFLKKGTVCEIYGSGVDSSLGHVISLTFGVNALVTHGSIFFIHIRG